MKNVCKDVRMIDDNTYLDLLLATSDKIEIIENVSNLENHAAL